jgi:hypothetical protein
MSFKARLRISSKRVLSAMFFQECVNALLLVLCDIYYMVLVFLIQFI